MLGGIITLRSPSPCARSSSATASSGAWRGSEAIPTKRSGSCAANAATVSLCMCLRYRQSPLWLHARVHDERDARQDFTVDVLFIHVAEACGAVVRPEDPGVNWT